jgi:hypothetical protein
MAPCDPRVHDRAIRAVRPLLPPSIRFIEPYPELLQGLLRPGDRQRVVVDRRPVQDVPLEVFDSLQAGDVLFIDSTHVVKAGSDVGHLFFQVVPRLAEGVWVHVHDVFFPVEYRPHHFLRRGVKQIWQEQYLLHAFLLFNSAFRVVLCNSYVHLKHRPVLMALFPWYDADRWPSSFWMQRVSADGARRL